MTLKIDLQAQIEVFTEAMRTIAGLEPDETIIADGVLHRIRDKQDKPGKKDLWYVLFLDGVPAGSFGHWSRLPDGYNWQAKADSTLTPQERNQIKERREQAQAARQAAQAEVHTACIVKAESMLNASSDPDPEHAYITGHQITPHGARQLKDMVLIPLRRGKVLTGLQIIMPDGSKKFLTGTEKQGAYFVIKGGTLVILCEGWATGCTIHELTGATVLVCFDCGNLLKVAQDSRLKSPKGDFIICADNDRLTAGNPDLTKARAAALAIGARLAVPVFPADNGTDFNDLARLEGQEAAKACIDSAALVDPVAAPELDDFQEQPEPVKPFHSKFMSAMEFLQNSIQIDWWIDRQIPRNSTGQLFGPSGGGKTFNAIDMALATATGGTALNGHRANKGLVLYLAGEGHDGLRRRVRGWQLHNNKAVENLELFYLSRNTISFEAPDIRAIVAEGKQLSEQHNTPIALIVIDTLARHLEGDENNAQDMGAFIKAVDALRSAFPGCVAMIVHHSGHGEDTKTRARGSSALKGAMDFEFCCDKGLLTVTKMKDGEAPPPIEFKLFPVKIGYDDDGEPITSCVILYGERSAKNREAELTATEKMLLGLVNSYPDILSGDLRTVFFDKRREREPEAKQDTLKRAFNRAFDGLIEKKQIFQEGHIVKSGHGTIAGHSGTCPEGANGTDRDTPLKGCPDVPPLMLTEILTLDADDFKGAIL
jgi:putative DNA primase/helicase